VTRLVETYTFTDQTGLVIASYTSGDAIVSHSGLVFAPVPLERPEVRTRGDLQPSTNPINIDAFAPVAARLLTMHGALDRITVVVHQGDADLSSPSWVAVFSGTVTAAEQSEDGVVALSVQSTGAVLQRQAFHQGYSLFCTHVLYSQGPRRCNASRAAATVTKAVAVGVGPTIELGSGWSGARAPTDYVGGDTSWVVGTATVRRSIVDADATSITLSAPWPEPPAAVTVSIALGCLKTVASCSALHGNVQNFGGQAWIPLDNPIGVKNIYSGA
jgi:hypothetical protein